MAPFEANKKRKKGVDHAAPKASSSSSSSLAGSKGLMTNGTKLNKLDQVFSSLTRGADKRIEEGHDDGRVRKKIKTTATATATGAGAGEGKGRDKGKIKSVSALDLLTSSMGPIKTSAPKTAKKMTKQEAKVVD
uniref:Uncharacterized protein n=1 Tax=Melanopsichium pennsylvanicum 4 TaxID=1398559 RepID=A0A077RB33_9BASI|nr:uncharacterized protein BN887_01454 [Melanopsichium pennsylvanicum 4]